MVVEHVVDHVFKAQHAGCHHVVATERCRNNRSGCGNHAGRGQNTHTSRTQHRIERCHQNHGQRGGTRNNDGQKCTDPENERDQNVRGMHSFERFTQDANHHVIGADMRHIGRKTEKRHDDEAGVGVLAHEKVFNGLKRINPAQTGTCLGAHGRVAKQNRNDQ